MITLPRGFVGPIPGGTLLDEIASLGGDEFRWFMRHGNGSHISDFHGQLRTLLAALVEMRGALEPFAEFARVFQRMRMTPDMGDHALIGCSDETGKLFEITWADCDLARQALQQKYA